MKLAQEIRKGVIERELQTALRAHIEQLEKGMTLVDGGHERIVKFGGESNPGRIDITATDRAGITVVIELKRGKVGRRAVGQILSYMGALMDDQRPIRGILIAKKFSPQAEAAARTVPALQLRALSSLPTCLFAHLR